jgi:hypothetical protein
MAGETQLETSYWQLTEEMNKTLNTFLKQHRDVADTNVVSPILHAFIAKILCSKTFPKTYPRQPIAPDKIGTLSSEEQAALHDTATHIATRIQELIVNQGICLENFKSIKELDDTPFIEMEYDEPKPETKDKIQNLLDNKELRDLQTLLINLQPYVLHAPPNTHFQTNESSLILSVLISLDIFERMTKDQPQETQTTPHVAQLPTFLNQPRTA